MTRIDAMKSARDALWSFASQGCDDANKALPITERMLSEMVAKHAKRKAPNSLICSTDLSTNSARPQVERAAPVGKDAP